MNRVAVQGVGLHHRVFWNRDAVKSRVPAGRRGENSRFRRRIAKVGLIGQPLLNTTLQLRPNQDLKSRITYSAKLEALTAIDLTTYIHTQLERVRLPHTTFTEAATNLITRRAEGTLRVVKNLCIGSMIEAVRDRTKTIDLKQVNTILLQPHWRHNQSNEPTEPILIPPQNLPPKS